MKTLQDAINVLDFEHLARLRMEPAAYDYFSGAAGGEQTLAANMRAFARVRFRPRVLVDTTSVDTSVRVLGQDLALPVVLAPTAFNRLAHQEGEVAAARAAAIQGTVMVVSTMASSTIEEISEATPGSLWFQLYVFRDRELTRALIQRAESAGYRAFVITVDTPRLGRRERDIRRQFRLPSGISARNLDVLGPVRGCWSKEGSLSAYNDNLVDPGLTWDTIGWVKSLTSLPIVLKGVMSPEDADCAARAGFSGVIVSNHGGRQLDGTIATIDALPDVVEAVDGRCVVMLDGGVRRGIDILTALAWGAAAVLIGRPYLWGLAVAGENGVRRVLQLLREELELAMALAGCPTTSAITRSLVARVQRSRRERVEDAQAIR